jgi:hypothetical protein
MSFVRMHAFVPRARLLLSFGVGFYSQPRFVEPIPAASVFAATPLRVCGVCACDACVTVCVCAPPHLSLQPWTSRLDGSSWCAFLGSARRFVRVVTGFGAPPARALLRLNVYMDWPAGLCVCLCCAQDNWRMRNDMQSIVEHNLAVNLAASSMVRL